jgi:eukaryotic-like serine/threonine-protein kinase
MSRPETDRNLLFGILALQMDFITRDALIASMNAWTLAKHRPLGEILVERGDLAPRFRALLEQMVDAHVERHGGDPVASLAALSSIDSTASSLFRSVTDPEVLESLTNLAGVLPPDSQSTLSFVPAASPPAGVRYRKVRDHAEGGLGIVFVARDEELNREVALKEIRDRHADDPDKRARFVVEAEITGRLEHPGIVPIYGLGCYDDGRPFYAMRFIKGDSLKDAIAAFHADETLKRDPGARALALQKLLRRFLDVCNAVAYAHSRGVLHRDLKPANVMVGKYGETLVVDWGLAKATGQSNSNEAGSLPESTMIAPTSANSAETLPGTRIGTPAYMSPEQAAGRLDLLSPASDVYSLGATLYSLITGQRAFTGVDLQEIYRKIEHGEFPRPRESSPWLDPALEAIALKAMSHEPEARYPSPRALHDDIELWLADEPVTAWREPWSRMAGRYARKHRTAVTTTTAVLLIVGLAIGGFAWQRSAQTQRTDLSALAILDQSERLAELARKSGEIPQWDQAIAEARRAAERLESGGGSQALRSRVASRLEAFGAEEGRRRIEIRTVDELEEARVLASNVKNERFDIKSKHAAYLAAFRASDIEIAALPIDEAAKRIRSSRIADYLIATLDDWTITTSSDVDTSRLAMIARAADVDPRRAGIRDAVARRDVHALRDLCQTEESRRGLGPRVRLVFDALKILDPAGSLPLLEAIRREHPNDFWLNHDLGMVYQQAKPTRSTEAVRHLMAAVSLRPDSPAARLNLSVALHDSGDLGSAIAELHLAIQIKPDFAMAHDNLGNALHEQGDLGGAIAEHRLAVQINPAAAGAHSNLGTDLRDQGDLDGAIAEHRQAIRIDPTYAKAHTNLGIALHDQDDLVGAIAEHRQAIRINPDFASAHSNLGNALREQGDVADAIAEHRLALRIDPNNPESHTRLGAALHDKGDLDGAIAEHRLALRIKPDLASAHANLGTGLEAKGDLDEAITEFRQAIRINPKLEMVHNNLGAALYKKGDMAGAIAEYRQAIGIKPNFAMAHVNLGVSLISLGDTDGALAEFRQAIRIKPDFAQAHMSLGLALKSKGDLNEAIAELRQAIRIKPDYPNSHNSLGLALINQGNIVGAIEEWRLAIQHRPNYAEAHYNLGLALKGQGNIVGAIEEWRLAIQHRPNYAEAHANLGAALGVQGDLSGEIASYRQAIRINPDLEVVHANLGQALKAQGDIDGAIAEFRQAIRIKPDYAGALYNLGLALEQQGKFAEALGHLERGHQLGSKQPGWRYPSAQWVARCRQLVDLEAKLPAILKGEATPRDAGERLALADVCYKTGRHAASARFWEEAFAEQPALADDMVKQNRYNAACAASLASSGLGQDDPMPDEAARAKLREKALGWLRADLTSWAKAIDGVNEPARKQAVVQTLAHWKGDADLAGIRDEAELAKLPEAEREAFRSLWANVEALRGKAGGGK